MSYSELYDEYAIELVNFIKENFPGEGVKILEKKEDKAALVEDNGIIYRIFIGSGSGKKEGGLGQETFQIIAERKEDNKKVFVGYSFLEENFNKEILKEQILYCLKKIIVPTS